MLDAVTRLPARSLVYACELTFVDRQPIDFAVVEHQHRAYCSALTTAGIRVTTLPAMEALPDSVFVEDAAVVLDDIAILTRPGALSRQAETAVMETALTKQTHNIVRITAPGTLDGGDVLRMGSTIFVGESKRTNRAGIEQLKNLVRPFGFRVHAIPLGDSLHLKTAVTALDANTLLINPQWIDASQLPGFDKIDVVAAEPFAANVLMLEHALIVNSAFPSTLDLVANHAARSGKKIIPVDISEFGKAEAGLTCLSLIFAAAHGNDLTR
jgi:dimethylargininase